MRVFLRRRFNNIVALLPPRVIALFFKVFEMRPALAEAAGYSVYPKNFYSPIPYHDELNFAALRSRRNLRDLELNVPAALQLIDQIKVFSQELDDVPCEKTEATPFWFNNGSFTDFDAAALY